MDHQSTQVAWPSRRAWLSSRTHRRASALQRGRSGPKEMDSLGGSVHSVKSSSSAYSSWRNVSSPPAASPEPPHTGGKVRSGSSAAPPSTRAPTQRDAPVRPVATGLFGASPRSQSSQSSPQKREGGRAQVADADAPPDWAAEQDVFGQEPASRLPRTSSPGLQGTWTWVHKKCPP